MTSIFIKDLQSKRAGAWVYGCQACFGRRRAGPLGDGGGPGDGPGGPLGGGAVSLLRFEDSETGSRSDSESESLANQDPAPIRQNKTQPLSRKPHSQPIQVSYVVKYHEFLVICLVIFGKLL